MQHEHVRVQRHPMQRRTKVRTQRVDDLSQRCLAPPQHFKRKPKSTDPIQQVQLHSSYACMCRIAHAIALNRSVHAHTIHYIKSVREAGKSLNPSTIIFFHFNVLILLSIWSNAAIQCSKLRQKNDKTLARFSGSSVPLQIHAHCSHLQSSKYNHLRAMENTWRHKCKYIFDRVSSGIVEPSQLIR